MPATVSTEPNNHIDQKAGISFPAFVYLYVFGQNFNFVTTEACLFKAFAKDFDRDRSLL